MVIKAKDRFDAALFENGSIKILNEYIKSKKQYFYDTLVYEGTKYGETSEFLIIGYTVSYFGEVIRRTYGSHIRHIDKKIIQFLNLDGKITNK